MAYLKSTGLNKVSYPSGHVLQMQHAITIAASSVVGTTTTIITKTFNRIKGDSHFICTACICLDAYANNPDTDGADPQLWWIVDGTKINTNTALSGDGFYNSDVPRWRNSLANLGRYDVNFHHNTLKHTASGSANDEVIVAVSLKGSSGGVYVNRSNGATTTGGTSTILITEVQ